MEKPEKIKAQEPAEKPDKPAKSEKAGKTGKPDKIEKAEKPAKTEKASKGGKPDKPDKDYRPRLSLFYQREVVPRLMKRFQYKSVMEVPRIQKIALNMGVGDAVQDPKFLEAAANDLTTIAGQKVVLTKAKKSISNFKLREGVAIGCRVTLRRYRMYEFLDRLMSIAIPRIRDFRGLEPTGFDGRGNYTMGIREHIIFPEINYDKVLKIRGLNVTIATSARTDEEAYALLREFGMPFRSKEKDTKNA